MLGSYELSTLTEMSRHMAIRYVPQDIGVLKTTVRQNLQLTAPNACDNEFFEALTLAELDINLDYDASLLSGGQQQRVALASIFLNQASIFLLDEPTSALDKKTALSIMQNLTEFAQKENKTIVMVTHDAELAQRADFILTLPKNAQLQDEEV